jgi:hypothetical protein
MSLPSTCGRRGRYKARIGAKATVVLRSRGIALSAKAREAM